MSVLETHTLIGSTEEVKAEARRKAKFERLETSKRNFFVRKRTKQQPIIDKAQTLVSLDALMRHYPSA